MSSPARASKYFTQIAIVSIFCSNVVFAQSTSISATVFSDADEFLFGGCALIGGCSALVDQRATTELTRVTAGITNSWTVPQSIFNYSSGISSRSATASAYAYADLSSGKIGVRPSGEYSQVISDPPIGTAYTPGANPFAAANLLETLHFSIAGAAPNELTEIRFKFGYDGKFPLGRVSTRVTNDLGEPILEQSYVRGGTFSIYFGLSSGIDTQGNIT